MGRVFSDQWGDFNGSIDDFRVYSVEVNASQVAELYNFGTGDFASAESTTYDTDRIKSWKDKSLSQRHAVSSYNTALFPRLIQVRAKRWSK